MAQLVVERMLALEDGQTLLVEGPDLAAPLIERVAARAAARGVHVTVQAMPAGVERAILEASSAGTLAREQRVHSALMRTVDATLRIDAADEVAGLADVPADRYPAWQAGRHPGNVIRHQRHAAGELRWAVVLWPCTAYAAEAGMSDAAYGDLVFHAARCDEADPVAAWATQGEAQQQLIGELAAGTELHVQGPGTDLRLRIAARTWRNSSAVRNLPDGEVFTGPHEASAEGTITFSYPGTHAGRRVNGIRLAFEHGVVVEATAAEGQDVLDAALATDEGARRLGEIGIGTNYRLDRFTSRTLLDEKIGGTVHVALGSAYPETGSKNQSAIHWDLVCDLRQGGELLLDGRVLQTSGRFPGHPDLER
jgi:aminopeptidase